MKKKSPTVVFFGSGPVAEKSLSLLQKHASIEAVITKSSTAQQMKQVTDAPIYSATHSVDLDALISSLDIHSPVAVLIDFGIIVSQRVIDAFPLGIINSHFSLLPELRGADPITFAVLSGQKTTGVSLMLLVQAMDEGPLLAQSPFELPKSITTPELTEQLINLSDQMLSHILPLYLSGSINPAPQETATIAPSTTPTYSRKLTKEDGEIDWKKPADQIEREIRAYAGWPTSYTHINDLRLTIVKAHVIESTPGDPGTLHIVRSGNKPTALEISCGNNSISVDIVKPEGKKEMDIRSFLAGYAARIEA